MSADGKQETLKRLEKSGFLGAARDAFAVMDAGVEQEVETMRPMTTEAREIDRERLARTAYEAGCRYPNWDRESDSFKDGFHQSIDAILQDIEAQGFRIEKADE